MPDDGRKRKADDAGPSYQSRKPRLEPTEPSVEHTEPSVEPVPLQWEPKHKIFLCHSGAQEPFTWHLFKALESVNHSPFFDRFTGSLRKGDQFLPVLSTAAENCQVAVLVLSHEFFTRSYWPMMELYMFVKAQHSTNKSLKILPLFLNLTWEQFEEGKRQVNEEDSKPELSWWKAWTAFEEGNKGNKKIDLNEWKQALSKIVEINLIYERATEGEPGFIKKAVEAICKLVSPDVKYDVSHVQKMDELCKPIVQKMKNVDPLRTYGVRVVGLYGMGGVGKTTISRAICNQKYGDFAGKVCHVELGSMNRVESLRKVLATLTDARPTTGVHEHELAGLLKKHLRQQKVFLVLDNLWDHQIDEVKVYLEAGYHDGSMVLVTSRSVNILGSLHISEKTHCLEMPKLEKEWARDVFLHYTGISWESISGFDEQGIINAFVNACCFLEPKKVGSTQDKESMYLPLALKVLGSQLGIISPDVLRWKKCLEMLEANKFNLLLDKENPVFSVLRLGYDALRPEERDIFLDMALLWGSKWRSPWQYRDLGYERKWMCIMHRKSEDDMKDSVNALRRKGLLDTVNEADWMDYNIHDLYVEFAEEEVRSGPFKGRRFLIDKSGTDVPHELLKYPSGRCWASLERLIIHNSTVQSLEKARFQFCKNVEVLVLYDCEALKEVDVTEMENLRSMEVVGCSKLGERITGVQELSNLVFLRWFASQGNVELKFLDDLSSLTALQVLKLENLCWSADIKVFPPDLSGCMNLRELTIGRFPGFYGAPRSASATADFGKVPKSVLKIDCRECPCLLGDSPIRSMRSLTYLQDLNLGGCKEINDLAGLGELISLQKLDVGRTGISELPDLRKMKQLEILDVRCCEKLTSLVGIANAATLRDVKAYGCVELTELPDNFSGLKQLEILHVKNCRKLTSLVGIANAATLREVKAYGCKKLTELPDNFSGLKQLAILDVSNCRKLTSLVGIANAATLREVKADGCVELTELPDNFSGLKQLKILNVRRCTKLTSLVGIANAATLREVKADGCVELKELPDNFSGLKQLEILDVSYCRKLASLVGIANAATLREVKADGCVELTELPDNFSGLKQLEILDVSCCTKLTSLVGIANAITLRHVNADGCVELTELPDNFSGLKQLKILDVRRCTKLTSLVGIANAAALGDVNADGCVEMTELPDNFSGLKQLEILDVRRCTKLTSLVGIANAATLQEVKADGCVELTELPDNFSGMKQLECLDVSNCTKLTSLVGIANAATLREVKADGCVELTELPDNFSGLKQLKILDVRRCTKLTSLVGIANAATLREVKAYGCVELKELPDNFSGLKQLEILDVSYCTKLTSLVGIANAAFLCHVKADGCVELTELPDNFSGLKQLEILDVSCCRKLTSLVGIANAAALGDVNADGCVELTELPDNFSGLKQLESLDVSNCTKLTSLVGIANAATLREVKADGCVELTELPDNFSGLKQLESLDVSNCTKLTSLVGIANAATLREVKADGCVELMELPDNFSGLKQLEILDFSNCRKLASLVGIAYATALRIVDASECSFLRELPADFCCLENLEMIDLRGDHSLHTLPQDYRRLAGRNILIVRRCWGLIVPLVEELCLQADGAHVECLNSTGCVARCEQSMQSWIAARRDFSPAAYDLLKNVFFKYQTNPCYRTYLLDDEEVDFVVRALCEHYNRGGTERLSPVLEELVTPTHYLSTAAAWAVVATAPCTFGVVTKRAMLEPWEETFHSTIVKILPQYGPSKWLNKGIMTLLQVCKEKLEEARCQITDPDRCAEGMEFVDTCLKVIEATDGQEMIENSVWTSVFNDPYPNYYGQLFLKVVFGPALVGKSSGRDSSSSNEYPDEPCSPQ